MTKTTFTDLGLAKPLLQALTTEGYETPTPIQAQAIPLVMKGQDLLGIAQTGTGKTAAFALPILHRLAADRKQPIRRGCRVLVLSPTRELATQIAESFKAYGKFFTRFRDEDASLVLQGVGHDEREMLIEADPETFHLTDHYRSFPVVLARVERLDAATLRQFLDRKWRRTAPRKAVKAWDQQAAADPGKPE